MMQLSQQEWNSCCERLVAIVSLSFINPEEQFPNQFRIGNSFTN
jgi:hypothetical protein